MSEHFLTEIISGITPQIEQFNPELTKKMTIIITNLPSDVPHESV